MAVTITDFSLFAQTLSLNEEKKAKGKETNLTVGPIRSGCLYLYP